MTDASAPRPSVSMHAVRRYRPDGGLRPGGLLTLLVVLGAAGVGLGVAAHFVGKLIYLILIFPAAIGAVLGALGQHFVKSGHLRNPLLGGLAGLIGGIFAMFVMHYASYYEFRQRMLTKIPAEVLAMSDAQLQASLAQGEASAAAIEAISATRGFPAYMALAARQGVEISHHGAKGANLGFYGSLIYWLLEVVLVAAIALAMMWATASAPYCAACEVWKEQAWLASISGNMELARQGVADGDTSKLRDSGPDNGRVGLVNLYRWLCPRCSGGQSTVDLELKHVIPQRKGEPKRKTVAFASWPGETVPAVSTACQAPAPLAPGV